MKKLAIVPAYKRGEVLEDGRSDGGVAIAEGGTSFTRSGKSRLPVMPGFGDEEATSIYSAYVYPNMFLDISGTSTVATCLHPRGPEQTTVVTEYLFRAEVQPERCPVGRRPARRRPVPGCCGRTCSGPRRRGGSRPRRGRRLRALAAKCGRGRVLRSRWARGWR